MGKISLNVKIDAHHLAHLDELARQRGCNRSEIARQIFENVQIVNRPTWGAVIGTPAQAGCVSLGVDGMITPQAMD